MVTRSGRRRRLADLVAVDGLADEPAREVEAREREETKRLVYVALTRARDRLYLASTLSRQGAFAPAPTSLGAVLPASLGEALARAATCGRRRASSGAPPVGAVHQLRVVDGDAELVGARGRTRGPAVDDFAPVALARTRRCGWRAAHGPTDGCASARAGRDRPCRSAAGDRRGVAAASVRGASAGRHRRTRTSRHGARRASVLAPVRTASSSSARCAA